MIHWSIYNITFAIWKIYKKKRYSTDPLVTAKISY